MKAFNGNAELKPALLACAAAHREADEYLAGTYSKEVAGVFRACSIGCTTRDVNKLLGLSLPQSGHAELAAELGIPVFIPRLADAIFEGLPAKLRPAWTERWIGAIPEGADLTLALPRLLLRVLEFLPSTGSADVVLSSKAVMIDWIKTGAVDKNAAKAAADAADAAANSAANSADKAAAYAAKAAAKASAKNIWPKIADALIESIKEAGNVSE